jgi:MoaA/NifB/PqqE/SkfB family radical SAM enzyme
MSLIDRFLRPNRPPRKEISTKSTSAWAEVDGEGRLVVPPEIATDFGLKPGARVRLDRGENHFRVHRPVTQLNKVYVEPTVACNLDCITCFRNEWENPMGQMSDATFGSILDGLKALDPVPDVYFGGIGEPLHHPMTPAWVGQAKALGASVELITNGTTLTEEVSRQLIEAGLDLLWVSIDGASPETFADVRVGANLPQVIENLKRFSRARPAAHHPKPEIGIAFLAMKRNIADLPEIIRLGKSLKATRFSVSNIQPATADMQAEALYTQVIHNIAYLEAPHLPRLKVPRMDFDPSTRDALFEAFNSQLNIEFAGNNWSGASDTCNFVESGTMSIAWNGDVSPCWPLMHTHTSYLHGKPRLSTKHVIGNVAVRSLEDLWLEPEYVAYRDRLHNFVFAPCSFCGGCDLSEANEEDCLGNTTFPVCGGCLWAQGIIQCP